MKKLFAIATLVIGACGPVVDSNADTETDESTTTTDPTDASDGGPGRASTGPSPSSSSSEGGSTTAGSSDFEGWYLVAIAPSLSPTTPFQWKAFVTAKDGELVIEMDPLTLDVGSTTTPRDVYPDHHVIFNPFLGAMGEFSFMVTDHLVPGPTNPITGSDITVDMTAQGAFVDPSFACGTVTGQVTVPINADLAGSTFAMMRLQDRQNLPVDFPTSCE